MSTKINDFEWVLLFSRKSKNVLQILFIEWPKQEGQWPGILKYEVKLMHMNNSTNENCND
jgi:hypothetical protein